MNRSVLCGRLTKDPELKLVAGSGMAVTKFTVAVDRFKKDAGADFITCVSFNKTAETIANYFQKGSKILLEGHIQTGSYENKEGNKVFTTDVIVDRFEFVDSKKSIGPTVTDNDLGLGATPVEDDSIPF